MNLRQMAPEGGGTAPLQERERQELMELSAQLKAEAAAAPTYERKEFYGSELERYEHLFQLSVVDGVALIAEDAAFMRAFEQGPAYPKVARRYDEMRTFFAGQHKRSAG